MKRQTAALLAAALLCGAASACPLPSQRGWQLAAQGPVRLAWRAPPIVSGRMFVLEIAICPASARLVAVDATMPDHGHGMNYATRLQGLPDGRWRAEGLLWHMSGRWELSFDIEVDGQMHTLRHGVQLR